MPAPFISDSLAKGQEERHTLGCCQFKSFCLSVLLEFKDKDMVMQLKKNCKKEPDINAKLLRKRRHLVSTGMVDSKLFKQ